MSKVQTVEIVQRLLQEFLYIILIRPNLGKLSELSELSELDTRADDD